MSEKTGPDTGAPEVGVVLVPQAHGGALRQGNPGNAGGSGRPPSRVKAALRKDFDELRHLLREFALGIVRVRIVPTCPKCGHESEPMSEAELQAQFPSVNDRIQALKAMAQYSDLGESGLPDDDLMRQLAQVVVDEVGPEPWPRIEARWLEILSRRVR